MTKVNNPNLQLPIDQYGRYKIVSDAIKKLATKSTPITILDVGGYKGELYKFFDKNQAKIITLDLYDDDDENYIKASALEMPFNDQEFDFVTTFEVFEHIHRPDREKFIKECMRVCKGTFFLTAPFSSDKQEVMDTEILVNDFWKSMYGTEHPWLKEHIEFGTPHINDLEKILRANKLSFIKIGNNDLYWWNTMLSFNYITTLLKGDGQNPEIQAFYNDHREEIEEDATHFYRYIYAISNNSKNLKTVLVQKKSNKTPSQKERIKNELQNKINTQLAAYIQDYKKAKQKEITTIAKQLKERIEIYDELRAAYEELLAKQKR